MKSEYDFSTAEKGKFYREDEELEIPVYLNAKVKAFYEEVAGRNHCDVTTVVNTILEKEMEIHTKVL